MSKDIKGWVAMRLRDIPDGAQFSTLDLYSPIFTRIRKTRKGVMVKSTLNSKTEKASWTEMEDHFYVTPNSALTGAEGVRFEGTVMQHTGD